MTVAIVCPVSSAGSLPRDGHERGITPRFQPARTLAALSRACFADTLLLLCDGVLDCRGTGQWRVHTTRDLSGDVDVRCQSARVATIKEPTAKP